MCCFPAGVVLPDGPARHHLPTPDHPAEEKTDPAPSGGRPSMSRRHGRDGDPFRMPGLARRERSLSHRLREFGDAALAAGRPVRVDLAIAHRLPIGFLTLLLGWHEAGAEVLLLDPPPHVRAMLWFRLFARPAGPRVWRLTAEPAYPIADEFRNDGRDRPETPCATAFPAASPLPR